MANVLFVYSTDATASYVHWPIRTLDVQMGISYISALLKQHGHRTRVLVLESRARAGEYPLIEAWLEEFAPDLVCHTAVATQYPFILDVAKRIRAARAEVFQAIGGAHVSLNPDQAIRDGFDAACIGEGEHPTLELVSQLQQGRRPTGIANLWIRQDGGIERNPTRPFLQDLDRLPFPDRAMWNEWTDHRQAPVHVVVLGRGCPFQCTYCCNHAFKKLAGGQYVRMRSPAAIAEEIQSLEAPPDADQLISLEVETIMLYPEWTEELCAKLGEINRRRQKPIRYLANLRVTPNADYKRSCRAFDRGNIRLLNIGLESGSERVRREILKRNYSNHDVIRAVRTARDHGIKVGFYNMVGVPGETLKDFLETARMNRVCRPDWHFAFIFFPYPGTELNRVCIEKGLLTNPLDTDHERSKARLDLPGFPRRRIQQSYDFFDLYVACRNPLWRRIRIWIAKYITPLRTRLRHIRGYWFVRRRVEKLFRKRGTAWFVRQANKNWLTENR